MGKHKKFLLLPLTTNSELEHFMTNSDIKDRGLFSERYGHRIVSTAIQIDSVDKQLRVGLWNCFYRVILENTLRYDNKKRCLIIKNEYQDFAIKIWEGFFFERTNEFSTRYLLTKLENHFIGCEWFLLYDILEYIAQIFPEYGYEYKDKKLNFINECNEVLEKRVSTYRFVGNKIIPITSPLEIEEIEQALDSSNTPVQTHLNRALELLSDRTTPDYRNSIKESISAVESMVRAVVNDEKGTLGQLIKRLEQNIGLHPSLKDAFSKLYGFTSDEGGIRHSLMEPENVRFEDAKYFLVVCSAFINYVQSKLPSPQN